ASGDDGRRRHQGCDAAVRGGSELRVRPAGRALPEGPPNAGEVSAARLKKYFHTQHKRWIRGIFSTRCIIGGLPQTGWKRRLRTARLRSFATRKRPSPRSTALSPRSCIATVNPSRK